MIGRMDRPLATASPRYRRVSPGSHPPEDPAYRSTLLRHPLQPLIEIPQTLSEVTGPSYPFDAVGPVNVDLTRQHAGAPLGEDRKSVV